MPNEWYKEYEQKNLNGFFSYTDDLQIGLVEVVVSFTSMREMAPCYTMGEARPMPRGKRGIAGSCAFLASLPTKGEGSFHLKTKDGKDLVIKGVEFLDHGSNTIPNSLTESSVFVATEIIGSLDERSS